METFLGFRGGLNENKSPLNPVLSEAKRGPVLAGIHPVVASAALPVSLMRRQRASAMKPINLLAAAVALVMGATPAFAANWVYVGSDINLSVWYYDADTIQRSGNLITVWKKIDTSRDKTEKRSQNISRQRYDCSKRTVTFLNSTSYYPDGTIKSFTWETYEQETDPIIPESMAETMLEAVCR